MAHPAATSNSMDDDLIRALFVGAVLLSAAAGVIGGFVQSVGGAWHDGERRLVLRQYGCLVRGEGYVDGGKQVYRGFASYGWARITRYDFGGVHLSTLGFRHEQWPALHGQPMGHFRLRLAGDALVGQFFGRRFRFVGARLHSSARVAPVPRRWTRA